MGRQGERQPDVGARERVRPLRGRRPERVDVDATLVRVLATLAIVFTFPAGLIAYAVAWAVMPKE